MSNMTQSENEIDISPMLNDINKVLKGHLSSLLGPIINEKNAIQSVLLNMPYVKRLKAENEVLRKHLFQMKTELQTTITFYQKELENANKKNVKLEVRDSVSNQDETPSKIVELKNQMWRENKKMTSHEDEEGEDDEDYMYGEEEEEEEEDEDDDEDYESPIITNLKMSLHKNNEDVVEITSAGTLESSEEETEPVKNVTVWNLNTSEENTENKEEDKEDEEDEDEDEGEDDEEEEDGEEEEDDDEEEEDDDEEEEETTVVENEEEEEDGEEELDVEDVEIDGVQYLTTSTENGEIYKCDEDGEIMEDENGDFVICGYFKNGIANFI